MTTTPVVIAQMQTLIDAWQASDDRRVVFLSCYAMMTRAMSEALDRGEFQDAAWVTRLLHRFAEYYFDAVDAYDRQTACPDIWRFTFDAARQPDTHVIQNLILGVNAHINFDLVLALVDLLHAEWADLSVEQQARRYHDHCQVNAIIAATVNRVQDQVIERYSPTMDIVDRLLGPVDEWLIARLIAGWREEVWHHAHILLTSTDDTECRACRHTVAHTTMRRARAIAGQRGIAGILDLA